MKKKLNIRLINILTITVAGAINATGIALFLIPSSVLDGGISGTSFLLNSISPPWMTISFFLIVLNVPFFIVGLKKLGLTFILYSLYAVGVYSGCLFLLNNVLLPKVGGNAIIIGDDILLGALFGGLLSGIGSGLVIRAGGSLDGMEVMAVTFAKKLGLTVGTFVMIYNALQYIIAGLVFWSWRVSLYSIIAYTIGIKAVDFMVEGIDKAKALFIVTEKPDIVAKELSEQVKRGITIINAKGYYSNQDKAMLYMVVNRFEIVRVKRIIKEVDLEAFISISDVSEVAQKDENFSRSIFKGHRKVATYKKMKRVKKK